MRKFNYPTYASEYNSNVSYLVHHTATRLRLQAVALNDMQLYDKKRLRQVNFEQQNTAQHRFLEIIRLLLRVFLVPVKKRNEFIKKIYVH